MNQPQERKVSVKGPPKIVEPILKTGDTCYVAVFGRANAGKRTFFKQLEIVGNRRFQTEADRQHFDVVVQRFVIQNMRRVIEALDPGNLAIFDQRAHLWDREFLKRRDFFAEAKRIYGALSRAPGFENDIQNVPGLDEWGPKMLTQYDRILKVDYCPNVDDFLRIIPLEGSRCDRCDFNYEGIKYKFFDYKNHGFKEPYSRYTEGKHKIVYIVDVGGPRAELEGSLIELEAIAVNHSVKIDVFYNKMENLHNMKERDFHAFDFQNLEPHRKFGYTPSSFVDAEFLKRITTGRMTSDFSEFVNYGKSTTTLSLFLGRGISY